MIKEAKSEGISAPSIEQVDASGIPSLVGFWKCDEAVSQGSRIIDYSGNGYHLTVQCGGQQGFGTGNVDNPCSWPVAETSGGPNNEGAWKDSANFLRFADAWGAAIPVAGTLLDTGSAFVVFGCRLNVGVDGRGTHGDCDIGTYWAGDGQGETWDDDATGFNIAQSGTTHWVRCGWTDGVNGESSIIAGAGNLTDGERSISGAFLPSAGMWGMSSEDTTVDKVATTFPVGGTIPAALVPQGGYFGIRAQTTWATMSGVRDLYVWSFPSEPPYLEETLIWLNANPGGIPPWWVG